MREASSAEVRGWLHKGSLVTRLGRDSTAGATWVAPSTAAVAVTASSSVGSGIVVVVDRGEAVRCSDPVSIRGGM
jgi:hypothetical protein